MKRQLNEIITSENNDDEPKHKIYKKGDIVLLDDEFNISYDIKSIRNIFIRHFAEMKCPFCNEKINEFISMDLDRDPEKIEFEPVNIQNHLRKTHKNEFLTIKKSSVDIKKEICKLILTTKKLI